MSLLFKIFVAQKMKKFQKGIDKKPSPLFGGEGGTLGDG